MKHTPCHLQSQVPSPGNTVSNALRKPLPLAKRFPEADELARHRRGLIAVSVVDTKSGERWENETTRLPVRSASIIKVPILAAALAQRPLDTKETKDAEDMIRRSDNDATTRFWRRLGPQNAIRWMQTVGQMRETTLSPENPKYWGYTRLTARDMATVVALIAQERLVSAENCRYILSQMHQTDAKQRWGVAEGSSRPALVANKNGWYPEEDKDDGQVWRVHAVGVAPVGDDPHRAVVVVLTRYPLTLPFQYGKDTCRLVAKAILERWEREG